MKKFPDLLLCECSRLALLTVHTRHAFEVARLGYDPSLEEFLWIFGKFEHELTLAFELIDRLHSLVDFCVKCRNFLKRYRNQRYVSMSPNFSTIHWWTVFNYFIQRSLNLALPADWSWKGGNCSFAFSDCHRLRRQCRNTLSCGSLRWRTNQFKQLKAMSQCHRTLKTRLYEMNAF